MITSIKKYDVNVWNCFIQYNKFIGTAGIEKQLFFNSSEEKDFFILNAFNVEEINMRNIS